MSNEINNYQSLLGQVKQRVAQAQHRAIYAANEELLRMYWDLGKILHIAQEAEGWGKGTLRRLSEDLKKAEYALRDILKPIGISDYELGQALPKDLRSSLPSIEEIEAGLDNYESK